MALNNRDRQRTRVVYVPVNTGGGSGGGSQEKIKVGESGLKFSNSTFTEVPNVFDFSDVTNMDYMFSYCNSLTITPQIDTSKATSMSRAFYQCSSLTIALPMNTSNVTNMSGLFQGCTGLTSVPELDLSNVTNAGNMFRLCQSLTDLGGFLELKTNLDLSGSSKLTHESLLNVINKAADVTAAPAILYFGSTNLAKLTDEEKAIATGKGWTLAQG